MILYRRDCQINKRNHRASDIVVLLAIIKALECRGDDFNYNLRNTSVKSRTAFKFSVRTFSDILVKLKADER